MGEIELTQDKIKELLSQMPEEAADIFKAIILKLSSQAPLNRVKDFVHFFSGDPIDNLISLIISKTIDKVEGAIRKDMKEIEDSGSETYSGAMAAKIAVKEMRKIADELEESIEGHTSCDCQVKH